MRTCSLCWDNISPSGSLPQQLILEQLLLLLMIIFTIVQLVTAELGRLPLRQCISGTSAQQSN